VESTVEIIIVISTLVLIGAFGFYELRRRSQEHITVIHAKQNVYEGLRNLIESEGELKSHRSRFGSANSALVVRFSQSVQTANAYVKVRP